MGFQWLPLISGKDLHSDRILRLISAHHWINPCGRSRILSAATKIHLYILQVSIVWITIKSTEIGLRISWFFLNFLLTLTFALLIHSILSRLLHVWWSAEKSISLVQQTLGSFLLFSHWLIYLIPLFQFQTFSPSCRNLWPTNLNKATQCLSFPPPSDFLFLPPGSFAPPFFFHPCCTSSLFLQFHRLPLQTHNEIKAWIFTNLETVVLRYTDRLF